MMPLKAYEEFEAEPLAFPIRGKTYTVQPLSAKTGIALVKALAGDAAILKQDSRSLWQMVLGPVYEQMMADDVPLDALARAGFACLVDWQSSDRAAAERVWESGIDPEARAALAAATRDNAGSTTSPSTAAAASSTKRRASTSGTRSRKPPAGKSTGKRSSGSGG